MAFNVVGLTSLLSCSFGTVPDTLIVLPDGNVVIEAMLAGNMFDMIPFANIPGFILCISLVNPEVATATAAAFGVLTPMPCTPMTFEPWITEDFTVLFTDQPAIDQTSILICDYAAIIIVDEPGNFSVLSSE